jgi:hypothetical protein
LRSSQSLSNLEQLKTDESDDVGQFSTIDKESTKLFLRQSDLMEEVVPHRDSRIRKAFQGPEFTTHGNIMILKKKTHQDVGEVESHESLDPEGTKLVSESDEYAHSPLQEFNTGKIYPASETQLSIRGVSANSKRSKLTHEKCEPLHKLILLFLFMVIIAVGYGLLDITISAKLFTAEFTKSALGLSEVLHASSSDFEMTTFGLLVPAFDFIWKYLVCLQIFPITSTKLKFVFGAFGVVVRILARFVHVYPRIILGSPSNSLYMSDLFDLHSHWYVVGGLLNIILRTLLELWFLPIFLFYKGRKKKNMRVKTSRIPEKLDSNIQGIITVAWNTLYYVTISVFFYQSQVGGLNQEAVPTTLFVFLYVPLLMALLIALSDSIFQKKHNHSFSHLILAMWIMMILLDYIGTSLYVFQSISSDTAQYFLSLSFSFAFELIECFFCHILGALGVKKTNASGFLFFIQFGDEFLEQMVC